MVRISRLWTNVRRYLTKADQRASRKQAQPRRAQLGMEPLETRVVPVTWPVTFLGDGVTPGFLRHAVMVAGSNDTIMLMTPGTYTLSLGSAGDANPASGDLDISGVTGLIIEPDPNLPSRCPVTIDGQWYDRIFDIHPGASVLMRRLTLENGVAWDAGYVNLEDGGAIRNKGSLNYSSCAIQNNAAENGGGIAHQGSVLTVNGARIDSNWAQRQGGGIYNQANMQFVNSQLLNNQAPVGGGAFNSASAVYSNSSVLGNGAFFGGGLYNTGSAPHTRTQYVGNWASEGGGINTVGAASSVLLQIQSDLYYNSADRGGGVFSESSFLSIDDSTVDGNYASREGGGVWAIAGRLRIEDSTVSRNGAGVDGAGVWTGSNTLLFNSTVSTNTAGNFGGGIFYQASSFASLNVRHGTISENWALIGGGVYSQPSGGPLARLDNTIVAWNYEFGGSFDDGFGAVDSAGMRNIIGQDWGSTLLGINNYLNILPNLGVLQNNGGPTETHALFAGPGVNAADPAFTFGLDQRGNPRPGGLLNDIGAFEL